jgi:hypothetical protein
MDVLCPAEARERDCDCNTRCDLPLQGSDADNCHTATAGFYDANKVVFVVECDDSIVVTEDNPPARLTMTGQTNRAPVLCM